ncbi:MAG TPA: RNB domain-containing ribonuclease [Kofleriaceae bacterium]
MGRADIDVTAIAKRVLEEQGFATEPPAGTEATAPDDDGDEPRDLRDLPWSSIDNEESRDLDQVEYAEQLDPGRIRVLVGIADVSALVPKDSPIDKYAAQNTATLYTGVRTFPMLPEALAMDRSSLLEGRERLAMVTEMIVRSDGSLDDMSTKVYPARVRNHAKLVYEHVGAWLEGATATPPSNVVIADQLRVHAQVTSWLRQRRIESGALELETIEARPVSKDGKVVDLEVVHKNRARELVEDLMIAVNGATARFLERRASSSIRRVVRAPNRWDRIVELAKTFDTDLPSTPNVRALGAFVASRRKEDPDGFPELSLTIVKLLGPGEYVLQRAADPDQGHFGLAVDDYMHSTAPNRRFPDLVTQRLLKAAARGTPSPYTDSELSAIATHCTERENAARKVERTMRKVIAATMLQKRTGEIFDAIVTGASSKGTYVRLRRPPAEGRVMVGDRGLDVGDRIKVRLLSTDPQRGFIDFAAVR